MHASVSRPSTTEGVLVRSPHPLTGRRQLRIWSFESNAARAARWHGELSLGWSRGVVLEGRQGTSDVGQGLPREAPPARKARGVGSPKFGARASENKVEHRYSVHEGWRR